MQDNEQQPSELRRRYVEAFNVTMVKIWKERIVKLGIIDTGTLFDSVAEMKIDLKDDKIIELAMRWRMADYGIYQDRGTGREVYRGNPGDIGRPKVRERREWITKAYYSSYMNLRDFFSESLGREFCAAIPRILGKPII